MGVDRLLDRLLGGRRPSSDSPQARQSTSLSFGEPEDLPQLDAECTRKSLLRGEPGTASASFEVGNVRGLEVSGIS